MLTGRRQSLQVEGHGQIEADGSFRRTYTGTVSDADGVVSAEATGNRFHLRYLLRQPAVYMEQYLYLQPDGRTILNQATITVIGQPWARLTEEITREDDRERQSDK